MSYGKKFGHKKFGHKKFGHKIHKKLYGHRAKPIKHYAVSRGGIRL